MTSPLKQTGQVAITIAVMLLIIKGNPSGWAVATVFVGGIDFVAFQENKRLDQDSRPKDEGKHQID